MKRGRKRGKLESFNAKIKKQVLQYFDKKQMVKTFSIKPKDEKEFVKMIDRLISKTINETEKMVGKLQNFFGSFDDDGLDDYYPDEDPFNEGNDFGS